MIKNNLHIWKKTGKRVLASLLCAGLLFSGPGIASASEETASEEAPAEAAPEHTEAWSLPAETDSIKGWPQGPNVEAVSAVVMDVVTEAVLYSKNADQPLYPASITKILTTLLACEELDMNDTLVVSEHAATSIVAGDSAIYAEAGEEFSVKQALMAVMLESANEMSVAVAEKTSGSVKKFTELMNKRADQLGCTNSHFNNPNGLPDETHYTTANDMAKISKAAWFNPMFRKFCTMGVYEVPPTNKFPETRYFLNHHKMMPGRDYAYDEVLGGKTGYTQAAGNTLVTFARRNGMILMAVVMGSVNGAWADTAALLDYGFNNFERKNMNVDKNPVPFKILPGEKYILKNNGNTYPFCYMRSVFVTVPNGYKLKKLIKKEAVLPNAAGPLRMKSKYYIDGHSVGWGMQYEKEILSNLLLHSPL